MNTIKTVAIYIIIVMSCFGIAKICYDDKKNNAKDNPAIFSKIITDQDSKKYQLTGVSLAKNNDIFLTNFSDAVAIKTEKDVTYIGFYKLKQYKTLKD